MQKYFDVIQDRSGNAVRNASVTVLDANGDAATLYADNGVTPLAQPLRTDDDGGYAFYAANGEYAVSITAGGHAPRSFTVVLVDALEAQQTVEGMRQYIGLVDGLVMDGVTDDAPALRAAIAAAPDYSVVRLPAGSMLIGSTIALPDRDIAIVGPGASSLSIVFAGSGGLFTFDGTSDSRVTLEGFKAIANAPACGRPIDISYASSTGLNIRTALVRDVIAEVGAGYWSGGIHIGNARNSVLESVYVHGKTDLSTVDGISIDGEATDVKISDTQCTSVAIGVDIAGTAEGTILTNFVVVDCNIGVSKVHSGNAEPWLAMTNWHINCRQKGIVLTNVLQTQINPGLLYANQAAAGDWVGIEIDGGLTQDIKVIGAQVNGLLATGAASKTALRAIAGTRLEADVSPVSMTLGVEFRAGVSGSSAIVRQPVAVTNPFSDAGTDNWISMFRANAIDGQMIASPGGFLNGSTAVSINKPVSMRLYGRDTAGTIKIAGVVRASPADANFTASDTVIEARSGDATVPVATARRNGAWQFKNMAAAPSSPDNGDTYYDTTANKLRVYANGAWADLH